MQSLHRVEKSHSLMVQRTLGQEISRLCVSIVTKGFTIHTGTFPPARDDHVGRLYIIIWQ